MRSCAPIPGLLAALLLGAGAAIPAAAQCMACVSSSACEESSSRGFCASTCAGQVCACSDTVCKPGITVAPLDREFGAALVQHDSGEPAARAVALVVHGCDGTVELLVYSIDGTRLVETRRVARALDKPDAERREAGGAG